MDRVGGLLSLGVEGRGRGGYFGSTFNDSDMFKQGLIVEMRMPIFRVQCP